MPNLGLEIERSSPIFDWICPYWDNFSIFQKQYTWKRIFETKIGLTLYLLSMKKVLTVERMKRTRAEDFPQNKGNFYQFFDISFVYEINMGSRCMQTPP